MFVLTFVLTFGQILANFERLVLLCIDADFCNQILILQHFSRSTRFSYFCTAPNLKMQLNFVKHFRIFAVSISKFHLFFAFSVQKSLILMEKIPEFRANFTDKIKISYILKCPEISQWILQKFSRKYFRKVRKTLEKS